MERKKSGGTAAATARDILGYLNFSSGAADPHFLGNINELFGLLQDEPGREQPVWARVFASSTKVSLPANAGNTRVDIDSGASSLILHVPSGVAARIRVKSGIASINIDSNRFPRQEGGLYESADYASAANRADITIDTGVGSVEIK